MRISTQREALFAQLQTVTRAASTRSAVQALSGVQLARRRTGIELRATDMEIGLRVPLDGEVDPRGRRRAAGATAASTSFASLPGDSVTLELRTAEQDVELVAGSATFHIRTLRLEDFPPFPEAGGRRPRSGPRRGIRRDGRQGRAVGVARRDAPGADRDPRLRHGRRAADGRHRLLPAVGQGDEAGGRRSTARSRRTCRRERCRSSPHRRPVRGGRAQRRRAHQPGRVRGRRHRPLLAPDRRAVPELSPAAAGCVRARAAARWRARSPTSCGASRLHGAEERPAAAGVQRGRADGVGAARPTSARRARRCRCRTGASRSRSASTPSSCATAWRPWSRATSLLKLISPLRPGLIEAADGSGFVYLLMPIRLNV